MTDESRRHFLGTSMRASSLAALSLGARELLAALPGGLESEANSQFLEVVPLVEQGGSSIGTLIPGSHRGRLVFDLSTLKPDNLVTSNDDFFIRTRYPDQLSPPDPWTIAIRGEVASPREIPLGDLLDEVRPMGVQLLECSGNSKFRKFGLLSAARWSGIPFTKILERMKLTSQARRVRVSGHDEHSDVPSPRSAGASWIFSFDQLDATGAYLATEMNGASLPPDHGQPARLIVPNWYGCTCIKWVNEIAFLDDDAESTAQMREFARRTHQDGAPPLARDFRPATMDQTGMPVRIEKWAVDGRVVYRVIGILWGGDRPTDKMAIRFHAGEPYVPLESYQQESNTTWTLWTHTWKPKAPGRYAIQLKVEDPSIRTRRLDRGYYLRQVDIDEV